jgi:hypothetical protein
LFGGTLHYPYNYDRLIGFQQGYLSAAPESLAPLPAGTLQEFLLAKKIEISFSYCPYLWSLKIIITLINKNIN